MKKILLPHEVCSELGIHRLTLNQWCDKGILHPRKKEPLGWRIFYQDEILDLKSRLIEGSKREAGKSILIEA